MDPSKHYFITPEIAPVVDPSAPRVKALALSLLSKIDSYLEFPACAKKYPHGVRGHGVYIGMSGMALYHLRKHQVLENNSALAVALQQTNAVLEKLPTNYADVVTYLEGDVGMVTVNAQIVCELSSHGTSIGPLIEKVLHTYDHVVLNVRKVGPDECEILYGRCGYLHCLLVLRKCVVASTADDVSHYVSEIDKRIHTLMENVLKRGKTNAATAPRGYSDTFPYLWVWDRTDYAGLIHGAAGILFTVLECCTATNTPVPEDVSNMILSLATSPSAPRHPVTGNYYPTMMEGKDGAAPPPKLVHLCHGAPGFVWLWLQAYKILLTENKEVYLQQARNAAQVVWERGVLAYSLSLCHGMAGALVCMLKMFHVTKEVEYFHKAVFIAGMVEKHIDEMWGKSDRPLSMYEGLSGLGVAVLEFILSAESGGD
eukprot:PhF_6_TR19642/c0_g1_i1/m.28657